MIEASSGNNRGLKTSLKVKLTSLCIVLGKFTSTFKIILSLSQIKPGYRGFKFLSLSPVFKQIKTRLWSFGNAFLSRSFPKRQEIKMSLSEPLKTALSLKMVSVIGLLK